MVKQISLAVVSVMMGIANLSYAEYADEDELMLSYGDEDFVSIATGRKQPIAKAPAVASVITAKDISAMGARDLDEVLESVPGVHVSVTHRVYNPVYIMRGIQSDVNPQVLVLVNGTPITNVFAGDRSQVWGGMPVESISRVEVIRGPGSAVYGADAFAGTINIITKSAQEIDGVDLGISSGSFDTNRGWFLYGGTNGGWDVAFTLEVLDTNGQDEKVIADAQTPLDQIFASTASFAPGGVNTEKQSLDMRLDLLKGNWQIRAGYQDRNNVGMGAGANSALDPLGEGGAERINFDITYHNQDLAENWDVEVKLSYFDTATKTDLVLLPPGTFGGAFPDGVIGEPDVYERHYRFDTSAFFTGFSNHDIRLGAGYYYQDQHKIEEMKNFVFTVFGPAPIPLMKSSGDALFNREEVREVTYLFVQDEWKLMRDWSLTAGVRYDHYSDFGDTVNPRFALVWDTTYNLTTKLLYGKAFRAPSFAEQFNINNPVAIGNDNLDPEIIDTYELAFDYAHSGDLRVGLNLFYYEMQDIIRFTPTAENTGDQTGHGLELEFEWNLTEDLSVRGNYAYQDSEDEDANSDAPNAPMQQLYLRADYRITSAWSLNSQLNHVMDRKRAAGDVRPEVDDYTTLDLTLRGKELMPGLDLAISLRNLTDEDVFEPSVAPGFIPEDLPLAGRSVFAEIRKSW